MTLARLLERAALRRPDADAVVDGGTRLSYGGLHRQARAVADGLAARGVPAGGRVLIALRNRVEHVVTYWACQVLGAVAVPVNFRAAGGELAYLVEDSGASAVLFEAATAPAVLAATAGQSPALVFVETAPAASGAPAGTRHPAQAPRSAPPADAAGWPERVVPFAALMAGPPGGSQATASGLASEPGTPLAPGRGPGPDDLSLILYTSGTTGRPKGVPRTHGNHVAGALAHVIQCGYEWGERTLGVMPLYHTMGIHSLTSMAAVNGCYVCQPDWSAADALRLIAQERLTALYLIPTLYYDLVHVPELAAADVTSVRKLAYAGAPMLAPLAEACVKAFAPRAFVNHYGSTEIYTFSVRPDVHLKPGCAGRAGIHATLRLVTASTDRRVGPDEVVAPGVKGEIIAALDSEEAFRGYWNRPDADARALRDGWYFTGDMGWIDGEGELHVAGRVDDMIISGGENIHPVEVEDVLARHPLVRDVAVVGEPDERWGERVVAFVVAASGGLTAEALDRHCREGSDLASFKRPRRIVFVAEIPKTPSGKILRRLLRDGAYTETP